MSMMNGSLHSLPVALCGRGSGTFISDPEPTNLAKILFLPLLKLLLFLFLSTGRAGRAGCALWDMLRYGLGFLAAGQLRGWLTRPRAAGPSDYFKQE